MMKQNDVNKHGLARYIPVEVKKAVRRACGFGCMLCGDFITQFDHIDPTYEDAKEHSPECIGLLCGACHDKKTRGIISLEQVLSARLTPWSTQNGYAHDRLCIDTSEPCVFFGKTRVTQTFIPLQIRGIPILRFSPPDDAGGPFLVNAFFYSRTGVRLGEIKENELTVDKNVAEAYAQGTVVHIRGEKSDNYYSFKREGGKKMIIEKMSLDLFDYNVTVNSDGEIVISTYDGERLIRRFTFDACTLGCANPSEMVRVGFYLG